MPFAVTCDQAVSIIDGGPQPPTGPLSAKHPKGGNKKRCFMELMDFALFRHDLIELSGSPLIPGAKEKW